MALKSTIFKANLAVADIDHNYYADHALTLARHPSDTDERMMTLGDLCALGSVKTNFGHLEAAAGIAGLLKTCLAIEHRLIPPSLHFETPNRHIPFDLLPLRVQTELGPWPRPDQELIAGVSAFGFGGTNAHLVLSGP